MKILIGSKGKLDFSEPLELTIEQKDKLIKFFQSEFEPLEIEESDEFRTERLGDKARFMQTWTTKEYGMLLIPQDNPYLVDKMARTWMSIVMKRMEFLPDFETWLLSHGLSISEANETLIENYLKEKLELKLQKVKERSKYMTILICKKCGQTYSEARFENKKIHLPKSCDCDGGEVIEKRIEKEAGEKIKKEGELEEEYQFESDDG